jgi:uncharacterized protein
LERAVLEKIDLPAMATAFGRAVHEAGIPVTPERSVRFARALSLAPPRTRTELYWAARTVFVSAHQQLATFDGVFASIFDGMFDPAGERGDANAPPPCGAEVDPRPATRRTVPFDVRSGGCARPGSALREPDSPEALTDSERELILAAASAEERLAERDFAELEPDELLPLRGLMHGLALAPPVRRVRRSRRDHHGARLDLRGTLRASCRTGGDPARVLLRERLVRRRRLVLLCDISGSMEPYARASCGSIHVRRAATSPPSLAAWPPRCRSATRSSVVITFERCRRSPRRSPPGGEAMTRRSSDNRRGDAR